MIISAHLPGEIDPCCRDLPARLAGKSLQQGSISPGKWADMIILSHNIFEIDPAEIADSQVDLTIFNGEQVFSR